jgi:nucleoside-diphosphate-sugar epimerase
MDVFLTGGTGYLGGRIAERLVERGHRVRLLYRTPDRLPPADPSILPIRGDLVRPDGLADVIAGVDAVIHTAALVKSWVPDPSVMYRVNVGGLESILRLVEGLRIPKLIYTSSFIALGPTGPEGVDEGADTERARFHNAYEETKYHADRVARRAQGAGAPLIILYPTVIFGPGAATEGNHVGTILRDFLRRRLPGRIGNGGAVWNYAYIDDVVEGHRLVLEGSAPGKRYILGGENVSMDGFLAALEEVSGVPAPTWRIPSFAARALAWAFESRSRLTGGTPRLTREVLRIYDRNWAYSSAAAIREIEYRPTAFREALARTVAWTREQMRSTPR